MAKIYKTALGKQIDVDHLALTNEHVIAVGNMHVNSRGDELGPGGKVVKTRDQIMKEYYALNTPVAVDPVVQPTSKPQPAQKPAIEQPVPTLQNIPGLPESVVTQPAPQKPAPAPVVEEPIVFNPNSGLDEEEVALPTTAPTQVSRPQPSSDIVADTEIPVPTKVESAAVEPPTPVAAPAQQPAIRGSLASSIAKTTTVSQVEKLPPKKANGVQRF